MSKSTEDETVRLLKETFADREHLVDAGLPEATKGSLLKASNVRGSHSGRRPQPTGRRTWPVLLAAASVLAVAGGGVYAARDGDRTGVAPPAETPTTARVPSTIPTTGQPTVPSIGETAQVPHGPVRPECPRLGGGHQGGRGDRGPRWWLAGADRHRRAAARSERFRSRKLGRAAARQAVLGGDPSGDREVTRADAGAVGEPEPSGRARGRLQVHAEPGRSSRSVRWSARADTSRSACPPGAAACRRTGRPTGLTGRAAAGGSPARSGRKPSPDQRRSASQSRRRPVKRSGASSCGKWPTAVITSCRSSPVISRGGVAVPASGTALSRAPCT